MVDQVSSGRHIEAIYRLSPMQEGLLFHAIGDQGQGVYFNQYSCVYEEWVDARRFASAWSTVSQRHPVLRTLFTWERRDQPLQIVRRQVDVPLQTLDWRDRSEEARQAQWKTLLRLDRDRGFELERAPLWRLTLIRLAERRWRLLWSFHHLVLDGWSMRLILDQVRQCYRTQSQGQPVQLPDAPPYADFIAWLERRDRQASAEFWSNLLGDFEAPTTPVDPAPVGDGVRDVPEPGRLCRMTLAADRFSALRERAAAQRVTLNTLLVGAWSLVLGGYCRSRDVVFGTTMSGRSIDLGGVEGMAGLLINTLPMRIALDKERPVADWLRAIQSQQLRIREHEQTPLVEAQRHSGVRTGMPLFETIVVFENFPPTAADSGDAVLVASAEDYLEYSNFPLAILVVPGEDLELIAVHDAARFSTAFVDRLLASLEAALDNIGQAYGATLADIPILQNHERATLLDAWNATQAPCAEHGCVHDWIASEAAKQPDAPAISDDNRSLSYRELEEEANRLARYLVQQGVRPGGLVPLLCERSTGAVVAILAILKSGAAYVPLDPAFPLQRVREVLDDVAAAGAHANAMSALPVVVTQALLPGPLPETGAVVVCIDRDQPQIAAQDAAPLGVPADLERLAYVIYTSGTTGRPKGVMVTHRNLLYSTAARQATYREPFSSYLLLSSLATDSSVAGVFWPLVSGAELVLPKRRIEQDMASLLSLIGRHGISHLLCVPSLYGLLLEQAEAARPASLQVAIVAGEACSRELVERHKAVVPQAALYNEYGPSEGTVWATVARLDSDDGKGSPPIGRPIANASIYILDDAMQPVPVGVAGELYIGGAGVALGYLNRPEQTTDRFVTNPFRQVPDGRLYRTGDLARYRPDGTVDYLGRADNQVKVRGYRVELEEIEQCLVGHPSVEDAAVVLDCGDDEWSTDTDALLEALNAADAEVAERLLSEIEALSAEQVNRRLAEAAGSARDPAQ